MAIYHLTVKPISRSSGRTSTGAAAYRSAKKVINERTGEIFDYTRKRGVEYSEIILPACSIWGPSRSALWNAAELIEKRKDACVAREHEVALPKELCEEDRLELARTYARDLADRHCCAVDLAIHAPHKGRNGKNNENYHAHVLCTTRQVKGDGLGQKCDREKAGRNRKADLEEERAIWADVQNTALELAGHQEQVDHRSLKAQGIDREPTIHLGPVITAMKRDGRKSDVIDRLNAAREAGERERAEASNLKSQIVVLDLDLSHAKRERDQNGTTKGNDVREVRRSDYLDKKDDKRGSVRELLLWSDAQGNVRHDDHIGNLRSDLLKRDTVERVDSPIKAVDAVLLEQAGQRLMLEKYPSAKMADTAGHGRHRGSILDVNNTHLVLNNGAVPPTIHRLADLPGDGYAVGKKLDVQYKGGKAVERFAVITNPSRGHGR